MNRIEQAATPIPAQQPEREPRPQPRIPRPLADVRRRAVQAMAQPVQAMAQPVEVPARSRRGASRLALAFAALAVPLVPAQAFGAAPGGGSGSASPPTVGLPGYVSTQQAEHLTRSRVVPEPLITRTPANTKQMLPGRHQAIVTPAVAGASAPACSGTEYPAAGVDSHMQAHLRPVIDPMNDVVTRQSTRCGARVDYLSQARA